MWRRATVACVAAVASTLMLAMAAGAKGPASATLTGPGIDEPIVFLDQRRPHQSHVSEAPVGLLGLTALWQAPIPPQRTPPDEPGEPFTITWFPFGSLPDRKIVQHVYLDAENGPVIHTPDQVGLDGWGTDVVGWFEAPEGLTGAIDEIVAWGRPAAPAPAWMLPAIALGAVAGLAAVGRFSTR